MTELLEQLRLEYAKNKVAEWREWEAAQESGSFDRVRERDERARQVVQKLADYGDPTLITVHLSVWESGRNGYDIEEDIKTVLHRFDFDTADFQFDSESENCNIYAPERFRQILTEIFVNMFSRPGCGGGVYTIDEPYPAEIYNWPAAKRYLEERLRR